MPSYSNADRRYISQLSKEGKSTQTRESIEGGRRLLYNLKHNSTDTLAKRYRERTEAAQKKDYEAGRAKAVWLAGDTVLRDAAHRMEASFTFDAWYDRRQKLYETLNKVKTAVSSWLCWAFGHAWESRVSTKYERAQSPWERQVQASNYPYQYYHRCSRFGCVGEKPK